MPELDARTWSTAVWILYAIGGLYLLGFVTFFFRLEGAAKRAALGASDEIHHYNRMLRGFPNALYARMLGRRPLQDGKVGNREGP